SATTAVFCASDARVACVGLTLPTGLTMDTQLPYFHSSCGNLAPVSRSSLISQTSSLSIIGLNVSALFSSASVGLCASFSSPPFALWLIAPSIICAFLDLAGSSDCVWIFWKILRFLYSPSVTCHLIETNSGPYSPPNHFASSAIALTIVPFGIGLMSPDEVSKVPLFSAVLPKSKNDIVLVLFMLEC